MGRRKIEIKAIKDDRNRSVTFLKRKGGLFKKAHELSVLCSVEVAVIIFGTNKKLYEYSSGNINDTIARYSYYGTPHEHKGPADYLGKANAGDDDEDEEGEDGAEEQGSVEPSMPPQHQMQNQANYSHMRQGPSASPPVRHDMVPYASRGHTPQPPHGMMSRPASRNDTMRRQSSQAPPAQQPQMRSAQHHPQNGYMSGNVYMQTSQAMYAGPHQPPPTAGFTPQHYGQFPSQHSQMQQLYNQDQRRASLPPQLPQHERRHPHPQVHIQPPQQNQMSPPLHAEPEQQQNNHLHPDQNQQQPHQPRPVKSRSIFTPIDDSRSMLAASWGMGAVDSPQENIKQEPEDRSRSVDIASLQRSGAQMSTPGPAHSQASNPTASARPSPQFSHPQRTQHSMSFAADASKRPRLKVHIPSDVSDDGGGRSSAPTSTQRAPGAAMTSTSGDTPGRRTGSDANQSGVVLPPPSPSASNILSAGATGPPNPFARPLPPPNNQSINGTPGSIGGTNGGCGNNLQQSNNNQAYQGNQNMNIETPMSALPSRLIGNQLLPSPSSFYPDWDFGRGGGDSGVLPSPLNFQTPILGNGPSFGANGGSYSSSGGKDGEGGGGTGDSGGGDDGKKRKGEEAERGEEKKIKA